MLHQVTAQPELRGQSPRYKQGITSPVWLPPNCCDAHKNKHARSGREKSDRVTTQRAWAHFFQMSQQLLEAPNEVKENRHFHFHQFHSVLLVWETTKTNYPEGKKA